MSEPDVILLEKSRKFMRFQNVYPKSDEELEGYGFYIKCILSTLSTTILFWGTLAHILYTVYAHTGSDIGVDLAIIISVAGSYYFNFAYMKNVKNIADVVQDLLESDKQRRPPGLVEISKKMDKYSIYHQIYIILCTMTLCALQLLDIGRCREENAKLGLHDICGLVANIWVPFDADFFPVKQIIYVIQIYSTYFSYATSSTISFSIMESIEHAIFRLQYVRTLFVEALREEACDVRMELLGRCVDYHNCIISIAQRLGDAYSSCLFVHVLLTGIIMGCVGYQLMQGLHVHTVCILIGWFMSLVMVAIIGQRLIDECTTFNEHIYDSKWYNMEVDMQKNILFVLLRSRRPIYLTAGSFGLLSYAIILSILKTSYSIISLLTGTS